MPRQADYVAGWIETTIHDFLREVEEPTSSMTYALITCLDSNFDVPSLLKHSAPLKSLGGKCQRVGDGILLTTRQLLSAERQSRLFFGFDEVWFFPAPEIQPKPENLVIVGPERIDAHELEPYSGWMRTNKCSLGLGDGTGMNFCLRVQGVARYIIRSLNEANVDTSGADRESA